MSNAPDVLFGMVPLVRAVVRSSTSATATTVTPDDSGTLFVNLSTSEHTYTLPTVAACEGKSFIFHNAETTAGVVITGGTVDLIMGGSDGNLADTVTCSSEAGNWGIIIGDGTYFYFLAGQGTWTASG